MKQMAILLVMLAAVAAHAQPVPAEVSNQGVIAIVLGKKITAQDKDKLDQLIFGPLMEQFAQDNKIEPTDEELDAFVLKTEEKRKQQQIKMAEERVKLMRELKEPSLSFREREKKEASLKTIESVLKSAREVEERTAGMEEQMRPMKRQMAYHFVRVWKINRALYEKYGGRVIFQQAGVEPLDAYRDFLREQEKKGAFQILDKRYEAGFWRYFTNDAMHTFYSKNDGAKLINTPWWMMEEPPAR